MEGTEKTVRLNSVFRQVIMIYLWNNFSSTDNKVTHVYSVKWIKTTHCRISAFVFHGIPSLPSLSNIWQLWIQVADALRVWLIVFLIFQLSIFLGFNNFSSISEGYHLLFRLRIYHAVYNKSRDKNTENWRMPTLFVDYQLQI